MFTTSRLFLRIHRAYAQKACALAVLCGALGVLLGSGCSDLPEGALLPSESTAIPSEGSFGDVNTPIAPSGIEPVVASELAINVKPLFCCDPLTLDLTAAVANGSLNKATVFEWDFGTGRITRGPSIRHTFPWSGTFRVNLTAVFPDGTRKSTTRDVVVGNSSPVPPDDGASPTSGDDIVEPAGIVGPVPPEEAFPVIVEEPPPAPAVLLAEAGMDREVQAGSLVWLDGTQSKGSGARSLRYFWKQSEGPPVSLMRTRAATTSFVAPDDADEPVLLAFELMVTEREASASDRIGIRVIPRPRAVVVANAGEDQTVPGGFVVQLDGNGSRSTTARPLSFVWKQIAGPTVALATPTEISTSFLAPPDADEPINLLFELTVAQGTLISKDSVRVIVQAAEADNVPYLEKVYGWMKALEPLPKIHLSWPMPRATLGPFDDELLYEYARITHSLAVYGEYVDQEYMNRVVATCQRVNDGAPDIPCTIAVLMRPWMKIFPVDAPVTYRGPEHDAEIQFHVDRLALVAAFLAQANQNFGSSVSISCIFMDSERFFARGDEEPDAEEWNAALDEKYDAIYLASKAAFPEVRVEWYGRSISGLFTLRELGDSYSVPLYHVNERDYTRQVYWRAYRQAVLHEVAEVTPWIALGTSYLRLPTGEKIWSFENPYDISISWQLGAEINDPWYGDRPNQFAPYHAARLVIFWPGAFEERLPDWPRHFVAYVRGAHGITEIPR